MVVEEQKIA